MALSCLSRGSLLVAAGFSLGVALASTDYTIGGALVCTWAQAPPH